MEKSTPAQSQLRAAGKRSKPKGQRKKRRTKKQRTSGGRQTPDDAFFDLFEDEDEDDGAAFAANDTKGLAKSTAFAAHAQCSRAEAYKHQQETSASQTKEILQIRGAVGDNPEVKARCDQLLMARLQILGTGLLPPAVPAPPALQVAATAQLPVPSTPASGPPPTV